MALEVSFIYVCVKYLTALGSEVPAIFIFQTQSQKLIFITCIIMFPGNLLKCSHKFYSYSNEMKVLCMVLQNKDS